MLSGGKFVVFFTGLLQYLAKNIALLVPSGRATKKKNFFTILLNYVVGWQIRSLLTGLLQYLAKIMAFLVQHFFWFFLAKPISAILRLKNKKKEKKVPMATKLEDAGPLKNITFFVAYLIIL